ncbi:MAG: outer membrane lipoprotein chaperone LolA [Stagnimonas sp.]|nr:outer membrane lipoprotein chaperone LolA [Stagnimonas sp.]
MFRTAFAVSLFSLASLAQAESAEAALARFVDGVSSYQATFTQVQTDERGKKIQNSSGTMALSRPGKFRWQYAAPSEQLIVTDGSKLWLYDQDLKQVTVRPAEEALQGTPAALLSQKKTLTETFTVSDEGDADGVKKLKLTPKSKDSDFQDVSLWLKAGAPVRMVFRDTLGGATDINFAQVKTNAKLDAALFRFTPPKGVEVIDAESPSTQ